MIFCTKIQLVPPLMSNADLLPVMKESVHHKKNLKRNNVPGSFSIF
ncbi:hypothetical protein D920_02455 [Enterococcus faecalis 13-SD-W-01]|nr:hypothetical protein D920_02455 [Enterococcus faecalis 13-SD-W-01]